MEHETKIECPLEAARGEAVQRKPAWERLQGLGVLRLGDLIQVLKMAQQQRMTPEAAALALGYLNEDRLGTL